MHSLPFPAAFKDGIGKGFFFSSLYAIKVHAMTVSADPAGHGTWQTYPPVAQLVEQLPLKEMVVGSNPTGRTRSEPHQDGPSWLRPAGSQERLSRVIDGQVAELVYALVLGTSSVRIEGSSPSLPTEIEMAQLPVGPFLIQHVFYPYPRPCQAPSTGFHILDKYAYYVI